jgi:hypothetical protein
LIRHSKRGNSQGQKTEQTEVVRDWEEECCARQWGGIWGQWIILHHVWWGDTLIKTNRTIHYREINLEVYKFF